MCELFGVNSVSKIRVNDLLKEFFSHSVNHPHGWGMAAFYENSVSLEKEPIRADKSVYLRERLKHKIEVRNLIAHIRLATVGTMEYENSHPFVKRDNCGRTWTLAHNGTIFDYPGLNPYIWLQEGRTDSERILCYLVDRVNKEQKKKQRMLGREERFWLLDEIICDMTPGNKMNLLIYDGEIMYIHTNYADSLYLHQEEETAMFATVPLLQEKWEPVPFTTLLAFHKGERVLTGTKHGHEYKNNKEDMKYLFVDFAQL